MNTQGKVGKEHAGETPCSPLPAQVADPWADAYHLGRVHALTEVNEILCDNGGSLSGLAQSIMKVFDLVNSTIGAEGNTEHAASPRNQP